MKKLLQDTNTLLASLIGMIGGLFWAIKSNWDYEPIILVSVSGIGLIIFLAIKTLSDTDKPIVEVELNNTGSSRGPMEMIQGVSPQDENGYYLHDDGGIYHF